MKPVGMGHARWGYLLVLAWDRHDFPAGPLGRGEIIAKPKYERYDVAQGWPLENASPIPADELAS